MRFVLGQVTLIALAVLVTLGAGEVATRIKHGALLTWVDLRPTPWGLPRGGLAEYDSLLGWVPRANATLERAAGWTSTTDGNRLRRNGPATDTVRFPGPPLLAIGNSGAFGDEVDDHETWPARLEDRLKQRVLNAGVSGYGIDQAVLRAERLYTTFEPAIVVFSIVSDDVTRTGLRFFYRWKPYFTLEGGELTLVRPPPPDVPLPEPLWLTALGHSHLARAIFTRSFPSLWYRRVRNPAHEDEVEVSALMLQRLQRFVDEHGGRLLVVLMAGGDGDARHIPALFAEAETSRIDVLDLSQELSEFAADPGESRRMFRPNYHLSLEGNDWMAARIAERLSELGWVE